MSLFVEPGSNRSVSGRFVASTRRARMGRLAGVAPCTVAIASTSPVVHVDDDRHAALRRGRRDLVDERLLDLVLQRLVDA